MKHRHLFILLSLFCLTLFVVVGCSSNGTSSSSSSSNSSSGEAHSTASQGAAKSSGGAQSSRVTKSSSTSSLANSASTTTSTQQSKLNKTLNKATDSRMIVYNAQLTVDVARISTFQSKIEQTVTQDKGYMVQMSQNTVDKQHHALLTLRVPQGKFYALINDVEKNSQQVQKKHISGQDVTKQYVDLQARLKAKQMVKARLTSYLKKATKTQDLLDISNQLDQVQTAIETIKGQMNYLKNQSALSTITITINETTKAKIDTKHLNTWQKTGQLFKQTINGIVQFVSVVVIGIVGLSPIIIILILIAIGIFLYRRRKKSKD